MSPIVAAFRAGVDRGWHELRQTFTNGQDLWGYIFAPLALTIVMIFMRGHTVPGTGFSLGARTLPSAIGMGVVFGGLIALATQMIVEREDGTLLRAKAIPNGMLGYLVGKLVLVSCMTIIGVALQLIPGLVLLDGLTLSGVTPWLMLAWVVVLGLIATLPIGAIIGSLFSSPRNMGVVMLPLVGLIGISGIFYPITNFPAILRDLAQVFPIYWLGLGMRSALLPDNLSAVEIGHSWRPLETFGVLAAWAVIGLVAAPIVLRRMARRESGSSVSARREAAMQRVR
jgi:ABC-2 type transport system permease protein